MVAELGFPIRWQKFHEVSEVHAPLLFEPTFYCLTTLSLNHNPLNSIHFRCLAAFRCHR